MAAAVQDFLTTAVETLIEGGWSTARACRATGFPRSTFYHRRQAGPADPARRSRVDSPQPAALSEAERATIVEVLTSPAHAEQSVCQTYWASLDAGLIGCSQSTFYRVARAEDLVGDRRRGRHGTTRGTGRPAPTATANGVNDLWSWDISSLRGPGQQRFQLMLVIDVYSRYPVGWQIVAAATRAEACTLFAEVFAVHGTPATLHSDNGAQMRSAELTELLGDTVRSSFSRPRVSDDNPFSEALFKTIKYDLQMPERFTDIDHAREWMTEFLDRYATEHHHVGLHRYTPHQVFTGTIDQARAQRQHTLDTYYQAHPERFRKRPQAAPPPPPTGINLSKAA